MSDRYQEFLEESGQSHADFCAFKASQRTRQMIGEVEGLLGIPPALKGGCIRYLRQIAEYQEMTAKATAT